MIMDKIIYAVAGIAFFLLAVYSLRIIKFMKRFFKYYEVLVFEKEELETLKKESQIVANAPDIINFKPINYDHAMDIRGTPTHVCPCGSNVWNLKASFEDYQIAYYMLDMECVTCGSVATAPTPIDKEGTE